MNREKQIEQEIEFEKIKIKKDFENKYQNIIEQMEIFFEYKIKEEEIIQIIKTIISYPNLTIFETMNLIYREVQIFKTIKNIGSSGKNRKYVPEDNIFEDLDDKNIKEELKNVIKNYKVYKENNNLEKYWLYINDSDKRRKLLKDENGLYNYIPLINKNCNYNINDNDCIYAKNENEILYHSLYYKTLLCKECDLSNEDNQENELCPYAHNILKDFRIIYNYKNDNIIILMLLLLNSNLFKFENYLNYIPMNASITKINIDTFKIHKCLLEQKCPHDYKICPFYHTHIEDDEPRRPQSLFKYNCTRNRTCFNELFGKFNPEKCCFGMFCQFLHSKNEENYYPGNFVGNHGEERMVTNTGNNINFEIDEKIKENKDGINNLIKINKCFICRKCNNISLKGEICYFVKCKHFICFKCFKNINRENKKANDNDTKILSCPFCEKKIKKKKVIFINFNKKEKEEE